MAPGAKARSANCSVCISKGIITFFTNGNLVQHEIVVLMREMVSWFVS